MAAVVWLRNDLRLQDNPALFYASEAQDGVVVVYIFCAQLIETQAVSPSKIDFILRHLQLLRERLVALKIPLVVEYAESVSDIPTLLLKLCQRVKSRDLYFNFEYLLDERQRDQVVVEQLEQNNISVRRYHERVIVPPGQIRNGQNNPYRVFTPFKKKWLQAVMPPRFQLLPLPSKQPAAARVGSRAAIGRMAKHFSLRSLAELWPAGEDEAHCRLHDFIDEPIKDYKTERNFPAVTGTSMLSPYLAVGSISPRQCLFAALLANGGEWDSGSEGAISWMTELVWREFYQHLAFDFPQLCCQRPMQEHTDAFPWKKDSVLFQHWCDGETGVPIVDAAMLQLKEMGWMHNRLRMIVAMYLTKNLQVDWRLGERYFMSQLIDGDFAANDGGWQWCASTGADAAPYFRIFNPVTQSKRFDPDGTFIRRYLPVLAHLSNKEIHDPPPTPGYPRPLVDLSFSRRDTIELFSRLRGRKP